MHKLRGGIILLGLLLAGAGLLAIGSQAGGAAQVDSRFFPETGQTVRGRFLRYWDTHGGLIQQGYPTTPELTEVSTTDGKTYNVQYFERAVFEYHPENAGTPFEVLLSLIGVDAYQAKYPTGAPNQRPHPEGILVPETGKRLGGSFLRYWEAHGGLAQQGYPISEEFTELSALDNKPYTVQYFQRAVFEYHPENKGNEYEVLLSQLGTYRHQARYNDSVTPTSYPIYPTYPPFLTYTPTPIPTATRPWPTARPPLPTIGAGGPAIPSPRPGDYYRVVGGTSANYVAWTAQTGLSPVSAMRLRALNMATGQVTAVAGITPQGGMWAAGGQVDESVIIWYNYAQQPINAIDLISGRQSGLWSASGWPKQSMSLRGQDVVWFEQGDFLGNGIQGSRIFKHRVGAPAQPPVLEVVREAPDFRTIRAVAHSPALLAWTEETGGSPTQTLVRVQDYATGTITTIATLQGHRLTSLAVDGTTIFWADPWVRAVDLRDATRTIHTLSDGGANSNIQVSNGLVTWTSDHPGRTGIWGHRWPGPPGGEPARLTDRLSPFALVGSWLVYNGPGAGLEVVRWTDRLP